MLPVLLVPVIEAIATAIVTVAAHKILEESGRSRRPPD